MPRPFFLLFPPLAAQRLLEESPPLSLGLPGLLDGRPRLFLLHLQGALVEPGGEGEGCVIIVGTRELIGLIPRLLLVSFPGSYWSHSQALIGLIPSCSMVSFPGSYWSHSQLLIGLIPRLLLVSFPVAQWSHSQALIGLIPSCSLVSFPGEGTGKQG